MALLSAGYWPTTYLAENYFNPLYWPVYGAVTGGDSARYYYYDRLPKNNNKELLQTLKILLESIKG